MFQVFKSKAEERETERQTVTERDRDGKVILCTVEFYKTP